MQSVINDILWYIDQGYTDISLKDLTVQSKQKTLLWYINKKLLEHERIPSITMGQAYGIINNHLCIRFNNFKNNTIVNNSLLVLIQSQITHTL